jgi:zinc protease
MASEVIWLEIKESRVPMLFEQSSYVPLVSMQIVFRDSGALYDTRPGVAEMSAKLLAEGTKADGTTGFARKLENNALSLDASAGTETFSIQLSGLKDRFGEGVGLLRALLQDPNDTNETLERIRQQKTGYLSQQKSDFDYVASLGLKEVMFPGTPRAQPREGTIKSISSMRLEEIRAYLQSRLGYNNAIVILGGDLNATEAQRYATEILTVLPKVEVSPAPYLEASGARKVRKIEAQTQQAYIYFGSPFYFPYSQPDQYLGKVAGYILGGSGFGSRLMEEIRVKRGLAYSAYGRFTTNRTTAYFSGFLQTKLESEAEAKALVEEIVQNFVKEGVTQEELDAAKAFLVGSEPLRSETLSQRLDRDFGEYYYERPSGYSEAQIEQIKHLDLKTLNDFIRSHPEIADLSFAIVTRTDNPPK